MTAKKKRFPSTKELKRNELKKLTRDIYKCDINKDILIRNGKMFSTKELRPITIMKSSYEYGKLWGYINEKRGIDIKNISMLTEFLNSVSELEKLKIFLQQYYLFRGTHYSKATLHKICNFMHIVLIRCMKLDNIQEINIRKHWNREFCNEEGGTNNMKDNLPCDMLDLKIFINALIQKNYNTLLFFICLAYTTGLRPREIGRLTFDDIKKDETSDKDKYYICIKGKTKTKINEKNIYISKYFYSTFYEFFMPYGNDNRLFKSKVAYYSVKFYNVKKSLGSKLKHPDSMTLYSCTRKRAARDILILTDSKKLSKAYLRHSKGSQSYSVYIHVMKMVIYNDRKLLKKKEKFLKINYDYFNMKYMWRIFCNYYITEINSLNEKKEKKDIKN